MMQKVENQREFKDCVMEIATNDKMIASLKESKVLRSPGIEQAFKRIDRQKFVLPEMKDKAYEDRALPLAEGQTISQPTTVAIMLELLDVQNGDKILDIGAGSGWACSLLADLAGEQGEVWAFEINETVGRFGLENIKAIGAHNIRYFVGDASTHWSEHSQYDRIHAAAAFEQLPEKLLMLLKKGGILVAPTKDGYVRKVVRHKDGRFSEEKYYGFAFVSFVDGVTPIRE
jgi:protein-L-isoaspartate(D-aspartate) O-methyltransferase